MIKITVTPEFKQICPHFIGAAIETDIINTPTHPALWQELEEYCHLLKTQYTAETIKQRSGILATRQAYKAAGKDPSRYRPACEQLARRVLQGKELQAVNTVVDLTNLVSLFSGYATAALDKEKIQGNTLELGIGTHGEPYEGIGRGILNIENLPVYRDAYGGVATPTSDNVRTMISLQTRQLVILLNGYDGNREQLQATIELTLELLKRYAQSTKNSYICY